MKEITNLRKIKSDFFNTLNEQLVLREEIKVHSIFNIFGKVLNSS